MVGSASEFADTAHPPPMIIICVGRISHHLSVISTYFRISVRRNHALHYNESHQETQMISHQIATIRVAHSFRDYIRFGVILALFISMAIRRWPPLLPSAIRLLLTQA